MDISWGSDEAFKFVTNVGLITTNGPIGPNIMSAEWTHHISYNPGIIAVCLGHKKSSVENIRKSKEFGVNLSSVEQSIMVSVSGGSTGKDTNKITALKELGFNFYDAKKINTPMVKDASLNLECKLIKEIEIGDHITFIGQVVESSVTKKEPLVYHKGKYWYLNKTIEKPTNKERKKIIEIMEKHRKN